MSSIQQCHHQPGTATSSPTAVSSLQLLDLPRDACRYCLPDLRRFTRASFPPFFLPRVALSTPHSTSASPLSANRLLPRHPFLYILVSSMFARNSTTAASSQYSSSWPFAVQQEPITACNLFSGCHHFPNECPFDYWSNSSPQPDKYSSMRNRPSRDKIRFLLETEQDMYLNKQELDQWIQEKNQKAEEEIKLILQKRSAKTMSAIPLNSVEVKDE
ncbi:hypothetical protein Sjap_011166 [Stephania japonica]|uniref:Uncharacterized protein n=1 Tax=Stephania japonica TaxID=461633 RepID=A0AAP0JAV7_9MAGN